MKRPDVKKELARLKDFQRATVDRAFDRLYGEDNPTKRFLIADEVGLGKTLVAKGLIAKTIDHLWDTVKRIDVVYVCSNVNIARQNRNRLRLMDQDDAVIESRITMLPLRSRDLDKNKVNMILLTPGTSLDLGRSSGMVQERALLLLLLEQIYGLDARKYSYLFCASASRDTLLGWMDWIEENHSIDPAAAAGLKKVIPASLVAQMHAMQEEIGKRSKLPIELKRRRNQLIGQFRHLLASACVDMLEPDLIILDEFQRFKSLLQGDGDAGELARQLFEYSGEGPDVRLVLLSATPYRMYGSSDDGAEEHYADFLATADFLFQSPQKSDELRALLAQFRQTLLRAPTEGLEPLTPLAARLTQLLRTVISRTDRIGAGEDTSGMLREVSCSDVHLHPKEIAAYKGLRTISGVLGVADPIEYWKSAPQALSYMDTYQLRKKLADWIKDEHEGALQALEQHPEMMIDARRMGQLWPLQPTNGKTAWLLRHTIEAGMWRCLWLPPALPYYPLEGPFRDLPAHARTKQLVFSAWQLVPRSLAATLSHEAERLALMQREGVSAGEPIQGVRKRTGSLLDLRVEDGEPQRMTNAGLLFPSVELARLGDPIGEPGLRGSSLDEQTQHIAGEIQGRIEALNLPAPLENRPDTDWYWAIPVLLDRGTAPDALVHSLEQVLAPGESDDEDATEHGAAGFEGHVNRLLSVARDGWAPRGKPPDDLVSVLAAASLGNPAICSMRALAKIVGWPEASSERGRLEAMRLAEAFRRLYNLPESIGVIEAATSPDQPYWHRCIAYGVQGCLSAVLDEFAHIAVEDEGLQAAEADAKLSGVAARMRSGLSLRRASVTAHQWRIGADGGAYERSRQVSTRFAVRFGEEKATDADGEKLRADDVRRAFNSPFWPFVLVTTSVGQEGLDFHWYAHSVIHWNLPNNPVDLEQREGRVHRYKGHAIRRNVAQRWGAHALASGANDPWVAAFDLACRDRSTKDCDLVPFWVYPCPDGVTVERHVPAYPLSKDVLRLERLRKALVLYRMVFGQARQEELLEFLQDKVPQEGLAEMGRRLRIDLSPLVR